MELQHHQLGALFINDSALNSSSSGIQLESLSQQRGVLQGRSANWPHDNTASPITNSQYIPTKLPQSQSPTENTYIQQPTVVDNRFPSSLRTQYIGAPGCGIERSEKQINREITRIYRLLQRSEKYQKYREKQPVLDRQQLVEKEIKEAMMVEKDRKGPEKSVWPEFLEHAFWRALIRWPPMGRKKFMMDGALRGRNELIQDSIYRDTGIRRDRKQVSSHLQVLKHHLKDQLDVFVYMAGEDEVTKRQRGKEAVTSYHRSHFGGRHHLQRRVARGSKCGYRASAAFYRSPSPLEASLGLGPNTATELSPYAVTDFTLLVEYGDKFMHDSTQHSQEGRLRDLNVTDASTWYHTYPEFAFLQNQTDQWIKKRQKILVCDTSIKVMTKTCPNVYVSIVFDLQSQRDLRPFESLVCTTCFYDNGKLDTDLQLDEPYHCSTREHRTSWEYTPDTKECSGRLRLVFSSKFLVNRILKHLSLRRKSDSLVDPTQMKFTAIQDVHGINPNGQAEHTLTIIWRFWQAYSSAEASALKWRTVSFGSQGGSKQEWSKQDSINNMSKELIHTATTQPQHVRSNSTHYPAACQLAQPPRLYMSTLKAPTTWPCTAPDLSQSSLSSAPSTTTNHHFPSPLSLPNGQGTASGFENEFDLSRSKSGITLSEIFSPAMVASYKVLCDKNGDGDDSRSEGSIALSSLDYQGHLGTGTDASEIGQISLRDSHSLQNLQIPNVQSCYSTKLVPSWHQIANPNFSLANTARAETYRSL